MAGNPQQNRTNRAENEMLLRRVLLQYGYDNIPDNVISRALMQLGPLGNVGDMLAMDFFARALTPRGTNIPPAGAVMVTGADGSQRALPLIELFDAAMRNSKNLAAKGMAGEAMAMAGASAAGLAVTGPVGLLVMAAGQLLGRSRVLEKIPVIKDIFSALKSAFTPAGTNLQPMNVIELSREMVTFTSAKLKGYKGLVFSGADVEKIADAPTENTNELTVKFDRIWRLEKKLPDPSRGPLHQLVKAMADYADKSKDPTKLLSAEAFDKDPDHPFYIKRANPAGQDPAAAPQRQESRQRAWEIATDSILSYCGVPDLKAANTSHVMAAHKAAMTNVGEAELRRAQRTAVQPPENYGGRNWAKVPDNHVVTLAARHNEQGIKTDSFLCLQTEQGPVFLGSSGKSAYGQRYTADEFRQLVESRQKYTSGVEINPSRLPRAWAEEELKSAAADSHKHLGVPVVFKHAEAGAEITRGRLLPVEAFPRRIDQLEEKAADSPLHHAVKLKSAFDPG